ncbi:SLAP domain-containing protein [Lederbergia citrea]|uniref:SLAP domain-containing protein n=1 Tax=Lederbergia citrea TaxID=2833581 RepID=UPI001BC8DD90|nr:SLAP domain-containing protein [Lederbergia citrea]MBS4204921.1 SLAP domain-containing protein [Lederbergia citrea]
MEKYRIHYHPMWEKTLSESQKSTYEELVETVKPQDNELTVKVVYGTYKRNGGFVITVFLNNGFKHALTVEKARVSVSDGDGKIIASDNFEPNLYINARSFQPWSFVFSKESILQNNAELDSLQVTIKIK